MKGCRFREPGRCTGVPVETGTVPGRYIKFYGFYTDFTVLSDRAGTVESVSVFSRTSMSYTNNHRIIDRYDNIV